MLDIKRLQYLVAVYRYRSFTRASEELFVSQSAISMAIKSLEAELGVQLIVRSPQNVDFTQEGKSLVKHALRILLDCENAERGDGRSLREQELHRAPGPVAVPRPCGSSASSTRRSCAAPIPRPTLYIEEGSMNNHIVKIQQDLMDLSFNALPCSRRWKIPRPQPGAHHHGTHLRHHVPHPSAGQPGCADGKGF